MTNKELEDLLRDDFEDSLDDDEDAKIDLDQIKQNLPLFSSEKICEMIVCDRCFGFGQKIDLICMEELAKRRIAGDNFNFESYIEQVHSEMPVLNFKTVPDIRTILNQAISKKINK